MERKYYRWLASALAIHFLQREIEFLSLSQWS
jgi:hypothetical protein